MAKKLGIRVDDGAENVEVIRRFALNLARFHLKKCSTRSKLKQVGWSDTIRSEILIGQKTSKVHDCSVKIM
ncbi:hypothetical protein ACPV5U_27335 [Vibrio mediterranei]